MLNSKEKVSLSSLINKKVEGLKDEASVELGLQHIIAALIGKDDDNIAKMDSL